MVRIEAFVGNRAKVYGMTERHGEILAGDLIKVDGTILFQAARHEFKVTNVSGFLRSEEFQAELEKVRAEIERQEYSQAAADAEFRLEVIDAIVAEGKSRPVAANLTNTQAKLMAEARRVGVI